MSENKQTVSTGGVGFLGLLGVLFIGLKLTGHIDWNWAWVTLPIWGGLALYFGVLILVFLVAFVVAGGEAFVNWRRKKRKARK